MSSKRILQIFILMLFSHTAMPGLDGELDESSRVGLTDEEQYEANTYNHTARKKRLIDEDCANQKDFKDLCTNDQYAMEGSLGQKVEMMIPIVTKAWAMFGNFDGFNKLNYGAEDKAGNAIYQDGSGNEISPMGKDIKTGETLYENPIPADKKVSGVKPKALTESELEEQDGVERKEEEETDYCTYIPTIGETAVTAFQVLQTANGQQQFDNTDPNSRQVASLRAVQKSHEDRSTGAWVQTGVWGAAGACYIAAAATGASFDVKLAAKMGASLLFTTFFGYKAILHKKRANRIKDLIGRIPKVGDCNPHTDTTCFCQEPSSYEQDAKNYHKYCMPTELIGRGSGTPMVCINEVGQVDAQCVCKAKGSCADKRLKLAQLKMGLNPAKIKDAYKGISPLTDGVIGNDFAAANERNRQRLVKMLKQFKPKKKTNYKLNNDQKKLAKEMVKHGIPISVAGYMASQNNPKVTPSTISAEGLRGPIGDGKNKFLGDGDSNLKFASKRPSRSSWGKKKKSNARSAGRRKKHKNENLDGFFADKAAEKAAIHKDKGKIIFDIITYRYKLSAWNRFEDKIIEDKIIVDKTPKKEPASEEGKK